MRKTKIVCTIGPASSDPAVFADMCRAGMNVARLNFSHGTHAEHQAKIDMIKQVREELGLPIAIMLDTKGPEYRIGTFAAGHIELHDGDAFTFTTRPVEGDETIVSVNYAGLPHDLAVGDRVLVNNGLVIFEVQDLSETDVHCRVVVGGELSNRKSMSFPNKVLHQIYLSEQDKDDLLFGIRNGVDFVAASFVSCKQDLLDLRGFLHANGARTSTSSPRSRTARAWTTLRRSVRSVTASWSHAATSVWRSRSRSCPPFRNTSSRSAACSASASSRPRKCLNL